LSTIQCESGGAAVCGKLVDVITALQRGADLDDAVRKVSLDRDVAVRFFYVIKEFVNALETKEPSKTATLVSGETSGISRLIAFSDGASRGNPGEASCAVIFFDEGNEELLRRSKRLGVATNNVAEYEGVLLALEVGAALRAKYLRLNLDSELVVRQLNGEYKVKHPSLKLLHAKAKTLMKAFDRVEFVHVSRKDNTLADKLASAELDGKT